MTTKNITWTVLEILKVTSEFFLNNNFENPRLNAERLLCHVLGLDRVDLYVQFEKMLTADEVRKYRKLVKRRASHEPLQYIVEQAEFMSLPFDVDKNVMIPRPETEILVSAVLELKERWKNKHVRIWDIGTGSGCIAVSLGHYWPECTILATDHSEAALEKAKYNARLNCVENVRFKKHDILNDDCDEEINFEIIISNPPYISRDEMQELDKEIRDFEPASALTDGKDGLSFYRRILGLIAGSNGSKFVFLEMSGTQTDKILLVAGSLGFNNVHIIKDLNQIPRVLKITV